ncbi:MAG: nucleotidyltransferase family protein [Betaproteobacteria bacterium]
MASRSAPPTGILLAAGASRRFGGDKLLVPLADGTPMAAASCRVLRASLGDVVAVVRTGDDALATLLAHEGARVVHCARAREGMGASLACGVEASADARGWIVGLADMPWIAPASIRAVADAIAAGASLAAPTCRGVRGHPVGFAATHRDALRALGGDEGARALLADAGPALRLIAVDDPGVLRDVDRPADLAR